MLFLLSVQYSLREQIAGISGLFAESTLSGIAYPQLNEFIAVGLISFKSVLLLEKLDFTYGFHFLLTILNSVPFLDLGDMIFESYAIQRDAIIKMLAPWGGFSMMAEAYWAFGKIGLILLGILLGISIRFLHIKLLRPFHKEYISSRDVYWVSLVTVLLLKYRSGISDAYLYIINFTIIYYFFILSVFLSLRSLLIDQYVNRAMTKTIMCEKYIRHLCIVQSHPTQFDGPLFRFLSKQPDIDLNVFFMVHDAVQSRLIKKFSETQNGIMT